MSNLTGNMELSMGAKKNHFNYKKRNATLVKDQQTFQKLTDAAKSPKCTLSRVKLMPTPTLYRNTISKPPIRITKTPIPPSLKNNLWTETELLQQLSRDRVSDGKQPKKRRLSGSSKSDDAANLSSSSDKDISEETSATCHVKFKYPDEEFESIISDIVMENTHAVPIVNLPEVEDVSDSESNLELQRIRDFLSVEDDEKGKVKEVKVADSEVERPRPKRRKVATTFRYSPSDFNRTSFPEPDQSEADVNIQKSILNVSSAVETIPVNVVETNPSREEEEMTTSVVETDSVCVEETAASNIDEISPLADAETAPSSAVETIPVNVVETNPSREGEEITPSVVETDSVCVEETAASNIEEISPLADAETVSSGALEITTDGDVEMRTPSDEEHTPSSAVKLSPTSDVENNPSSDIETTISSVVNQTPLSDEETTSFNNVKLSRPHAVKTAVANNTKSIGSRKKKTVRSRVIKKTARKHTDKVARSYGPKSIRPCSVKLTPSLAVKTALARAAANSVPSDDDDVSPSSDVESTPWKEEKPNSSSFLDNFYSELSQDLADGGDQPLINSQALVPHNQFTATCSPIQNTSNSSGNTTSGLSVYQKQVIQLLSVIKEQNSNILSWISKQEKKEKKKMQPLPGFPVKLPIACSQDIQTIEVFMTESEEHSIALCKYLASIGGRDFTSCVNNIMRSIMTDHCACEYSFFGMRGKLKFGHLLFKTVIVRAMLQQQPSVTEKQVENCIKVWLKHAPGRIAFHQKKRK